jgi:AmmeMemoRadiSam system protein B
MRVRPAAVAGFFYPGNRAELSAVLDACLAAAEAPRPGEPAPKALIVPHAGYVYSGPVAASAFARLAPLAGTIRRVVLLGPAHRHYLRGLAAPRAEGFATPLGVVPVDRAAIDALRDLPQVTVSDEPHFGEHSLEVQLPFLQRVLRGFALVPLVVGEASPEEVEQVIERSWGGPETLLVVSSDLSHYHDYAAAQRLDRAACAAIEALDPDRLGPDAACGDIPVRGLLRAARTHGLAARTLDLRSSGDTGGDRARVVGYGAWAFAGSAA